MRVGLGRQPLTIVDTVLHLCVEILAGSIHQVEGHLRLVFQEHLLFEIHTEGLLAVAERQRHLTCTCLSGRIGHVGNHHEVIEHRIAGLGHLQGHRHVEGAVVACDSLAGRHLDTAFITADDRRFPVAAVRPPPVGCTAQHLIAHLRPLYGHAGIAQGRSLHRQRVTGGIGLLHLGEVYVERRTLVLFHLERVTLSFRLERKASRQSCRRQGELGRAGAIIIGDERFLVYHLIVRVAQGKGHGGLCPHLVVDTLDNVIEDDRGVNGLSRTVDRTVGIDTGAKIKTVDIVIRVVVVAVERRTGLVALGIGKHLTTVLLSLGVIEILSFLAGDAVGLLDLLIADVLTDPEMSPHDGLTRLGIHHHVAHDILDRLCLGDGIDFTHVIEVTAHLRDRIGLDLHHIHAHRQTLQRQLILEELIGLLARIGARLFAYHLTQQGLDLLIAIGIVGRQRVITLGIYPVDLHRQRRDITQLLKLHGLRLLGQNQLLVVLEVVLRIGHLLFGILQDADTLPRTPLLERLVNLVELLAHGDLRLILGAVIAQDGQFTALGQILIDLDQRVDLLQGVVLEGICRRDTGSTPVACLRIEFVERVLFIQLVADDVQQVVVEDAGIDTFHDHRTVGIILQTGHLLTERLRQFGLFHTEPQRVVLARHAPEHRLPHRL